MDLNKIGAFIGTLRKEKNLTQLELAEKLYITDRAVSKWECGKGLPDIAIMIPLCKILEISVTELLNGERIARHEAVVRAEQQIVNQLQEQNFSKKKMKSSVRFSLIAVIIALPFLIMGNFASESVLRILFNILCISVMALSITVITALSTSISGKDFKERMRGEMFPDKVNRARFSGFRIFNIGGRFRKKEKE